MAVDGTEKNLSMSRKFAVLKDNLVENTVLCDDEVSAVENFGNREGYLVVEETELTGPAGTNFIWDGEKFNNPNPPTLTVEEPQE